MADRFDATKVLVVLAISLGLVKPADKEDCHLVTAPVLPLKVNVVLLVPLHTVAEPARVPPTEVGLTVTVAVLL